VFAPDPRTGVLCMAYGSPTDDPAAVAAYYTHIRGGRAPSPERLADLAMRYHAIGGSPLNRVTAEQAAALGDQLGLPTFVGMKHAPPFIADGAAQAAAAGVERLVALPLAPHFARMSFGGYESALRAAWSDELIFITGFHTHPAFVSAVRMLLHEALSGFTPERVFFTAHSLPARIVAEGDDYPGRLHESCRLVAEGLAMPPWSVAFQSASETGEPWLGPALIDAIAASGASSVLVCPIGFVADHLEILYDIDIATVDWGREHGVRVERTRSFNADPVFIAALADIVRDAT
jgi:protoporphyrin/coproporphyrin ferrochelatase